MRALYELDWISRDRRGESRRREEGGEEKWSENEGARSGGKERNGVAWKKWSWMGVNSVKGWRVLAGISKKATHGRRRRALEMHGVHQVLTIKRERGRERPNLFEIVPDKSIKQPGLCKPAWVRTISRNYHTILTFVFSHLARVYRALCSCSISIPRNPLKFMRKNCPRICGNYAPISGNTVFPPLFIFSLQILLRLERRIYHSCIIKEPQDLCQQSL